MLKPINRISGPPAHGLYSVADRFPHIDFLRMQLRVGDKRNSIFSPETEIVEGAKDAIFQGAGIKAYDCPISFITCSYTSRRPALSASA